MKPILAILALVVIGFAVVMLVPALQTGAGPSIRDDCKDDPRSCSPFAVRLDAMTSALSPGLDLPDWTLDQGAARNVVIAPVDDGLRVARMQLRSGRAVVMRYSCDEASDDDECPQTIAMCAVGALLDEGMLDGVDRRWRSQRRASGGAIRCRDGDDLGGLVIYPQGGRLEASALDNRATIGFE